MNVEEALSYINKYTWSKTRLGLDRTRALLKSLGNPQNELEFIHVAGSNGKGSTCAMLESILRQSGFITGFYSSPYVQEFKESFQASGKFISDEELCDITEKVSKAADLMEDHPSQFEIKTAIAMLFFVLKRCRIVVLETGMGGEFDSTNVIDSNIAAVITNITLEHTQYLGSTLAQIASAKAGIVKSGSPVITYENKNEVMEVLQKKCVSCGCDLYKASNEDVKSIFFNLDGQLFEYKGKRFYLSLLGKYQLNNVSLVLKTVEVLRKKRYDISDEAVSKGLKSVFWPARFEVLAKEPLFVLDGGHNLQCAQALKENVEEYFPGVKFVLLFGVLSDKNYLGMADVLSSFACSFVCTTPESPRALCAEELCRVLRLRGYDAKCVPDPGRALNDALSYKKPVIAFGSLYMAGEIRKLMKKGE